MRTGTWMLVGVALVGGWYLWSDGEAQAEAAAALEPEVVTVERRTLSRVVEAVGVVEPAFLVEVKSKASGEITSMPFDEGDRVEAGALLAELLPVDEERNLRRQRAAVQAAEANLLKAGSMLLQAELNLEVEGERTVSRLEQAQVGHRVALSELERQKSLVRRELSSRKELDAAERSAEDAESTLEQARSDARAVKLAAYDVEARRQDVRLQESSLERERVALEVAELRLRETRILASMSGVVLTRDVQPGQIIASGISTVSGGTTLMTLADVSRLYLEAEVDESDIGELRPGLPVELTAEAYTDRQFRGTVIRVAPQGKLVQNVTIFGVRIELGAEAVRLLRPGMNATARMILERHEEVLAVPVKAIRRKPRPEGASPEVSGGPGSGRPARGRPGREQPRERRGPPVGLMLEVPGGEPRFVSVERGLREGSWLEVRGEFEEGARVLLPTSAEGEGNSNRDFNRGMRSMGRSSARRKR